MQKVKSEKRAIKKKRRCYPVSGKSVFVLQKMKLRTAKLHSIKRNTKI